MADSILSDFPSPEQIEARLRKGDTYAEAIDGAQRDNIYDKFATFKLKTVDMSDNQGSQERLSPEEITRENFLWRTKEKEIPLDEMDVDFKITAFAHALKHANRNFVNKEKHERERNKYHANTKYFMRLCEILEQALAEDHGVELPQDLDDVKAMKRMINEGVIKVDRYKAPAKRNGVDNGESSNEEE